MSFYNRWLGVEGKLLRLLPLQLGTKLLKGDSCPSYHCSLLIAEYSDTHTHTHTYGSKLGRKTGRLYQQCCPFKWMFNWTANGSYCSDLNGLVNCRKVLERKYISV